MPGHILYGKRITAEQFVIGSYLLMDHVQKNLDSQRRYYQRNVSGDLQYFQDEGLVFSSGRHQGIMQNVMRAEIEDPENQRTFIFGARQLRTHLVEQNDMVYHFEYPDHNQNGHHVDL